jgi:hypothetical protein
MIGTDLYRVDVDDQVIIICNRVIVKLVLIPFSQLVRNVGPPRQEYGVYFLYLKDILVYIGKSTTVGLNGRLNSAYSKIINRQFISIDDMTCKYVFLNREWVNGVEELLISNFDPEWNGSGFGHRPGVDTNYNARIGESDWEQKYPLITRKVSRLKFRNAA